ncbi:MAG TPA: hypothetical protein VMX94_08555 [Armatimonadota bacterium]|nr:hypothetical protein [Armatimonadota bacterium]
MHRILTIAFICAVVAGTLLASDAPKSKPPIPYAVGNRWEYSVSETAFISFGEGESSRSVEMRAEGTSVVEIVSVKERRPNGDIVYLERETENTEAGLNTEAEETVIESFTLVSQKGIYCLSHRSSGPDGALSDNWIKYEPPLLDMPPDLAPGKKWKVGVLRDNGIRTPFEAQVMGHETITVPAGTFEKCLKICGTCTKVSGTVAFEEGKAAIKSGKIVVTMWVYPGVGIVKEDLVSQLKMAIKLDESGNALLITGTSRETTELQPGYKAD